MADKPIGTMFVELDLDASRYTKGQQKLLKDAQSTSLSIEQNFKNLGIKSSAEMDLMRSKIKNSFDMIANSSKSTANDILRAERAKNEQLDALNKKQFGEQASMIESIKGKWIGMAAVVYASARAIGQAIDMTAMGSKLEKQSTAFENLARSAGTSSDKIIKDLRAVSDGMVAEAELIGSAGKAMLMGIQPGEITRLMEIAAATSKSTGQTITEAFNDITMGVARQSKMILDNLGIMVDVDKANRDYAASLGKTSDALTDAEKRQAFMNSVMKSGEDMIRRIGASTGSLDNVNKLIAAQSNLWNEVSKTISASLDKELGGYVKVLNWIDAKLKSMRQSQVEATKSDLWKEIEMLRSLEQKGMAQPGSTAQKEAEYNRRYLQPQFGMKPSEELKRTGSWSTPAWSASSWREREGRYAEYTEAELKAMAEQRDKLIKGMQDNGSKIKKAQDDIWKDYKPRYSESQQSEAMLADQKAFEDWKKLWASYEQRLPESQQSEAMLADQKVWEEWKKNGEDAMSGMVQLSEATAEAMQQNFSDLFFDAFTGKLKSIEDYAKAIFTSIQRAAADMAGQMATEYLFGSLKSGQGSTGSGGGLIGTFLGLFTSAGGPQQLGQYARGAAFGRDGLQRFGFGGVVDRPTVFPFSKGIGMMGESGPEAIMPLKRLPGGKLGVEAGGRGNNVTINVQAPKGYMDRESLGQVQAALFTSLSRSARRNA